VSTQATGNDQPQPTGPAPAEAAPAGLVSAAAARGALTLSAAGLGKDFRLGHGQILHAVRDVSLSLYRSAVVALVGESGSGKSTVARMLAGQEHPTTGTIVLDEHPVEVTGRRAFRSYKSEVQYVFQDPFASLNPAHTVRYHIERPLRLHRGRLSRKQVSEQAKMPVRQRRGDVPAAQPAEPFPAVRPGNGGVVRGIARLPDDDDEMPPQRLPPDLCDQRIEQIILLFRHRAAGRLERLLGR